MKNILKYLFGPKQKKTPRRISNVLLKVFGGNFKCPEPSTSNVPSGAAALPDHYSIDVPACFKTNGEMKAMRGRYSGATYFIEARERVTNPTFGSAALAHQIFTITRQDPHSGSEESKTITLYEYDGPKDKVSGLYPIPKTYECVSKLYEKLTDTDCYPYDITFFASIPFEGNGDKIKIVAFAPKGKTEETDMRLAIEECCLEGLQRPSRYSFVNVGGGGEEPRGDFKMKTLKTTKEYVSRSAKAVYRSLYDALKTFYDYALDPVKFEELREMCYGEKRKEVDKLLEEYRQRKQQTEEQNEDETEKGKPYDKHMAMCNGVPVW